MELNTKLLNDAADNIRVLAATMVEKAKSGHPGGAMGGADFVNVLYSSFLITDPDNPTWFGRDRFFLDPGHMSPMLYSVLALTGKYTVAELQQFRQWGSVTPGHPELDPERGVENTSGPLGQGHTMAVGAAIAERFFAARFGEVYAHKTYAFISDGGIQEEISQGAGRLAERRADAAGDLGGVVRHRQAVVCLEPMALAHQVVPFGNEVAQRAARHAERRAAIHAACRLFLCPALQAGFGMHVQPILDAFLDGAFG